MDKKKTVLKIGKIVLTVLLYLFFALCLFAIIMSVISKKDEDGAAVIFGYEMRFVRSESMEACELTDVSNYKIKDIPVKSLIFVQVVPEDEQEKEEWYASLQQGDVLTFRYVYAGKQETITHRIIEPPVQKESGGYIIRLAGDNKNSDTGSLVQTIDTSQINATNYVIGKVTGQSYILGLFVYALKTPLGIALIVIIPCAAIIIMEVIRIASVIGEDRKKKAQATQEKQESEIEELKRQLAALQGQISVPAAESEPAPAPAVEEAEPAEDSAPQNSALMGETPDNTNS